MHDFRQRFMDHEMWESAADRLFVLDEPVNLLGTGVADLLGEYEAEKPALVVFDLIYAMGMSDDNGTKDVMPMINALKKISAAWSCATLAVCHSGHSDERRVRGSSVWRQQAAVEWHMAKGQLTCQKSKIADKTKLDRGYTISYPSINWTSRISGALMNASRESVTLEDRIVETVKALGGSTRDELTTRMGMAKKTVLDTVTALLAGENPRLIQRKEGRAYVLYAV